MTAEAFRIQAIRGFQAEREIPLAPTLTVIYGENGRGKTSLCEGWHWLFTGEMLPGLEPQSELGDAGKNIHVDLEKRAQLIGEGGQVLAKRSPDGFENPSNLPDVTSPVLLQYRLQQVLFAAQRDRRGFFERVLELDVESEFAQKLRRACLEIDPTEHDSWKAWERAVEAVPDEEWHPPNPIPSEKSEQEDNEQALLNLLGSFFACEATPESIEQAIEAGASRVDIPLSKVEPPVSEEVESKIEEARSALESLSRDAEQAFERVTWRKDGLEFVEPPSCPFCTEDTIDEAKLQTIRSEIEEAEEVHRAHREARSKRQEAVAKVLPLVQLDVEETREHLETLLERVDELGIEDAEGLISAVRALDGKLQELEESRPEADELEDSKAFLEFSSVAIEVSQRWLAMTPELATLREKLEERRLRVSYTESATSILQYFRSNLESFYTQLNAGSVLDELADAPDEVDRLKRKRLDALAGRIVDYYRTLRPDDPTPLEEIESAGGVRGDIRIRARSRDKIEHASKLFSFSNANALGMAAHIARVLNADHDVVVFDDPFQSLDDSNRNYVISDLIKKLLDNELQVVIVTHEREEANTLLNKYADRGGLGTQLRWDTEEGAVPVPMFPNGDVQLATVLDGIERADPSEILKVVASLRQLLECFCVAYLEEVGGPLPASGRRNLGTCITKLEGLSVDVRPNRSTLESLKNWNNKLSDESHFQGAGTVGMNELKAITREALKAQRQEKQLRPPDVDDWSTVPRDQGIKERARRIIGYR